MGDRQRKLKENIGINHVSEVDESTKRYQGTPQKARNIGHNSGSGAFPTTPARSTAGQSTSTSQMSTSAQIGTPVTVRHQAQTATPVPTSKTVAQATSRAEASAKSNAKVVPTREADDLVEDLELQEVYEDREVENTGDMEFEAAEGSDGEIEEIFIEPSDLVRAEDEDFGSWSHEELAVHTGQMNLALLQLAEDIAQWRVHCAKLNKTGKEVYDQYVQQCHRLQRTSTLLKQARRDNGEMQEKLVRAEEVAVSAEQRLQAQQDRFKSNLDACQVLKDSLAVANRRIKELETSKIDQNAKIEEQLNEREMALENAMQLAQSLSQNLDQANSRIAELEEDKEALESHVEALESHFEEQKQDYEATIVELQKENADYSQQIDNLAETPSTGSEMADDAVSCTASEPVSTAVPETPTKRAGNSSPQKRVEALSIRVEALRAHNTKLSETVAYQEKHMKLQLDEAAANEMKWKAVAKKVQGELEALEEELDAQKLANASLTDLLENAESKMSDLQAQVDRLSVFEARVQQLTTAVAELEEAKSLAQRDAAVAKESSKFALETSAQLEATREELDALRAAHQQSEDDLRLIYLQHKQEKADLEATYKHEDYKTRYHESVQRASVLHQRLSNVLQFVASNQALANLAAETPDMSTSQPLTGAWMSQYSGSLASSSASPSSDQIDNDSHSVMLTPLKGTPKNRKAGNTPRAKIASMSPYASPVGGLSAKKRVGRTPAKFSVHTRQQSSDSPKAAVESRRFAPTPLVVPSEPQDALAMTQTLVEAYRAWKAKCEHLASRVVALETLLVRERQNRFEAVAKQAQEHSESLQNNLEALHISHDAQVERYEAELEMQRLNLEAQTEAYQSLHVAYHTLAEDCHVLRSQLHNASSDLITYRAVYEEAKVVESERVDLERKSLLDEVEALQLELDAQRKHFEARVEELESEVQEKERAIYFLDTEASTEAEERKKLVEQHSTRVFELETQIEAQQLHIESQDSALQTAKAEISELETVNGQIASSLESSTRTNSERATALIALSLTTQCALQQVEMLQAHVAHLNDHIESSETEKAQLLEEVELLDMLFGRAKGTLISQSVEMSILKQTLEQERIQLETRCHQLQATISAQDSSIAELATENASLLKKNQTNEAQWTIERDELVQKLTESRVSLVSTTSRLDQVSLELSEVHSQFNAIQEESEHLKAHLVEVSGERVVQSGELERTSIALKAAEERVEALIRDVQDYERRLEETKSIVLELTNNIETSTREGLTQRAELDKLSTEAEQLKQEVERVMFEKERVECELERKTSELQMAVQSNATLESSRDQLEVVVTRLEASQLQLQESNTQLEQTLESERDEKKKLCDRISDLQEQQSMQALQVSNLEQRIAAAASNAGSSSNSIRNSRASLVSSQQLSAPGNGSSLLVTEELEAMLHEHHDWLQSMKNSLIKASQVYVSDVSAKRVEMDQEYSVLKARITTIENLLQDREEERDALLAKVSCYENDLALAKNSHRFLILQNGMLMSLIAMAESSERLSQEIGKKGTIAASSSSIVSVAKETGFIADKQECMKLERQCQSWLLKAQLMEDENKALKQKLDEAKLNHYVREDALQAQLSAIKQRLIKCEELSKSTEHSKLQLATFICQIKDSLIRLVQIPAIRELLMQWASMMNAMEQSHLRSN